MINNILYRDNSILLKFLYVSLFCIFITPFSVTVESSGVSANYLYVFFPIIAFFINKEISWPPKSAILFISLLCLIFFLGVIFQADKHDLIFRRSASFLVFMAVFTLLFVRLDALIINSFKISIVIWSVYEASFYILEYIDIVGNSQGFNAKGILGTQRIGFIYILGFWIAIMFEAQNKIQSVLKFTASFVIIAGLFLTYTRSSILALAFSIGVFLLASMIDLFKDKKNLSIALFEIGSKFLYIFIIITLVAVLFRGSMHYYSSAIINYVFSNQIEFAQDNELILYTSLTVYDRENLEIKENKDNLISIEKDRAISINLDKELSLISKNLLNSSSQIELMNSIISNVAKSKEAIYAQKDLNKANLDFIQIKKEFENLETQILNLEAQKNRENDNRSDKNILEINNKIQEYLNLKKQINQKLLDKKNNFDLAQSQIKLTLKRLLAIELQQLLSNLYKQLEALQNQKLNDEIQQKTYDIEKQISDLTNNLLNLNAEVSNENAVLSRMKDKGTSVGYRVFMHKKVLEYVMKHPFLGSSFLGVWVLSEDKVGSAHSQYLDVLFRIGLIAFLVYIFFIIKVAFFLFKTDLGLFFGFMGFLFFGLFHETIKLSQGSFVFAFLFSMWANNQNLKKIQNHQF